MSAVPTSAETISAVIPVRDGEAFLNDAIDSVLGQTVPPTEVIVVDDGSRDGTADIAEAYGPPVRVVRLPPRNQSVALNHGIEVSTGTLLAFCDADDAWTEQKLERQLEVLTRDPELLLVSGLVRQFVAPGDEEATRDFVVDTRPVAGPLTGTLLARRRAFERVGPFDEAVHLVSGVDWMARARSLDVRVEIIDAVVLLRRVHGQNVSVTQREQKDHDLVSVIRAHRRRGRESPTGG